MKKLYVLFLSMALILGLGSGAKAATSALQNMPGGAGIVQWMAAPDGTHTLINIQNILASCGPIALGDSAAIMIHITFYDWNSHHMWDMNWPMSAADNVGVAVTGDGANVYLDFEPGETLGLVFPEPPAHHSFPLPGLGTGLLQLGYATVAITALDSAVAAACYFGDQAPLGIWLYANGNADGNPNNDPNLMNTPVVLPNMLFARAAILFPDGVLGTNGVMLQDFANMTFLDEGVLFQTFTNVIGLDANCAPGTVDWNNDTNVNRTTMTDFMGIDIQYPELYFTVNYADIDADGNIEVALQGAGLQGAGVLCTRNDRRPALGSYNRQYWGRYNVEPGLTDTDLTLVFPASNPSAYNPAPVISDNRNFSVVAYDDDEHPVSTPGRTGPEVIIAPFASATNLPHPGMPVISHSAYTHGEAQLITAGRPPMFGFVYTTVAGTGSDIYPLIMEQMGIMINNEAVADLGTLIDITVLP